MAHSSESLNNASATAVEDAKSCPLPSLQKELSQKQCKARVPSMEEFCAFDTYVFDCHGVLYGIPEEDARSAVDALNKLLALGKQAMFVTNDSNQPRSGAIENLSQLGVHFGERSEREKLSMVICASYTTANYLKQNGLRRPFVITSHTGILEEMRLLGITEYYATVEDTGSMRPEFLEPMLSDTKKKAGEKEVIEQIIEGHPDVDCIVVGWDTSITARKIATAINYIKWHEELNRGKAGYTQLPVIACSSDAGGILGTTTFKGQTVKVRTIGNGAMADIITRSFDPPLEWLDMGKPSDVLIALMRDPTGYNVNPQRALMIGDTIQTDILFGNRIGMKTLLTLNGVTTLSDLQEELSKFDDPFRWPAFVLPKLGSFHSLLSNK